MNDKNKMMIKERPIIFSGEMIQAILIGRKNQTRRIIKSPKGYYPSYAGVDFGCPYGKPGDRLWVRESFCQGVLTTDTKILPMVYRADCVKDDSGERIGWWIKDIFLPGNIGFKSSIHMPRWASRITLEIVSVRVERLQDINETGAIFEGVSGGGTHPDFWVGAFKDLWESIHKKENRWEDNPLVWVIEFKLLERSV